MSARLSTCRESVRTLKCAVKQAAVCLNPISFLPLNFNLTQIELESKKIDLLIVLDYKTEVILFRLKVQFKSKFFRPMISLGKMTKLGEIKSAKFKLLYKLSVKLKSHKIVRKLRQVS